MKNTTSLKASIKSRRVQVWLSKNAKIFWETVGLILFRKIVCGCYLTIVEHLLEEFPEIGEYLSLPPGYRFLLAAGYEDVWYDEKLLVL